MIGNYGGRQPNSTSYIKTFITQGSFNVWNNIQYTYGTKTEGALITSSVQYYPNLIIPGNLYIGGDIIHEPFNIKIKENISPISQETIDNVMKLTPVQFTYKDDPVIHYGLTPSLEGDNSNYVSLIPILIEKIKDLQEQIDEINSR
jgi:hypothetical protein